ncbi:MAG: universal stress protein [Thermomicrobiales bacterium]|nr:universal stress protein [Thermomicrobiales bacterium]
MTTTTIHLAAERPELMQIGQDFCATMLPDALVQPSELANLTMFMDDPEAEHDLIVLVMHADENGQLTPNSATVQSIMTSTIPVLVLRDTPNPNHPLQRIVVPLDGSTTASQAIPVASRIARRLHLPVQFVMVIDPSRVIPPAYTYDPDAWSLIEDLRETSHWALQQSEEIIRRDGVQVDSSIVFGPINASLQAMIDPTDLVVMCTHGPKRHGLRYSDSVTQRTLVAIPAPMIVMRASQGQSAIQEGYAACSWIEPLRNGVQMA